MDVTIVIPAYNEETAIGKVIHDIQTVMRHTRWSWEILVVDDHSSDKTAAVAESLQVRVIRRPITGGPGTARKIGILHASGEIIVMFDADGSYEPADIPVLLQYFPGYDQVNGARTSEEGTLKWLRKPAKWFIRQLACYLTSTSIPDLNTGFKAFKKSVMMKYLWVLPSGFSCVTTMTLAFLVNGYAVKYVPTKYYKRIGKSKFHPIKDTAAYFQTVVRMVMYFNPLRVFMPIAGVLLLLGIIKSYFSFQSSRALEESEIIIFMTAIMLASLGLISDLIVAYNNRS